MRKGFTLLELIIVVAILGILSSIAVNFIVKIYNSQKINTYLYLIYNDLEKTRNLALKSTNATFECINSHSYEIRRTLANGTLITVKRSYYPDISISCNVPRFVFKSNGLPDSNGSIKVTYDSISKRIVIDHFNGEIKIE